MEILGFDVGYVRTLDKQRKKSDCHAARGLSSPEFLTTAFPWTRPSPLSAKRFSKHKSPTSALMSARSEFKARTLEREGLVSLAMVPIVSNENVHGFIALGSRRLHHFSGIELGVISDFCSQLGSGLANVQLLDGLQARASELEQRVHEQLARVERLEGLKRFFLLSLPR